MVHHLYRASDFVNENLKRYLCTHAVPYPNTATSIVAIHKDHM